MPSNRFSDAIVMWLDPHRPDFGVKLVDDVPTALDALHRHGLDEVIHGPQSQLWASAAGALVQADIDPTPKNLRTAYAEFLRLVKRTVPVPTVIRSKASPRGLREQVETLFALA